MHRPTPQWVDFFAYENKSPASRGQVYQNVIDSLVFLCGEAELTLNMLETTRN